MQNEKSAEKIYREEERWRQNIEAQRRVPENADLDDCPYSYFIEDEESAFSCRWCRLKRARIAVEEEMDNDAV